MDSTVKFEEVVVVPAVPAAEAVLKKVMVISVTKEVKEIKDLSDNTNKHNRIANGVTTLLVVGITALFVYALYTVYCTDLNLCPKDDNECDEYLRAIWIMALAVSMFPVIWAASIAETYKKKSTKYLQIFEGLLKQAGWDGITEYRLEIIQEDNPEG